MTAVNSRLTNPRQIALFATNETELSVVRETRIAKKPSSHEYFWYSKTFLYFLFTGSQPPLAFRQLFDRQPDIRLADKGKHDSAGQQHSNVFITYTCLSTSPICCLQDAQGIKHKLLNSFSWLSCDNQRGMDYDHLEQMPLCRII